MLSSSSLNALVKSALVVCVAGGALARCSCEDEPVFEPGAVYTPASVLDFGEVAVDAEKTLSIAVRSSGTAALTVAAATAQVDTEDEGKWVIEIADDLASLAGGVTSSITVTYRPCPDAWDGDVIDEDYDLDNCPGDVDSGLLVITDNTDDGGPTLDLTAIPVQAPTIVLKCPVGTNGEQCGVEDPDLQFCNGTGFGSVPAGGSCDLVFEIENAYRNDKPVATLLVDQMGIKVKNFRGSDELREGADVGFEFLTMEGEPLAVDSANPFEVPVPSGETRGTKRFKIRFSGLVDGFWVGTPNAENDEGLRVFSSDPDNRVVRVNVSGSADAPKIQCNKVSIDFGPVEQGTTSSTSFTCDSVGLAPLEVQSISTAQANPEFSITTDRGAPPFTMQPFDELRIYLSYAPADGGIDLDTIIIATNDLATPMTEIGLRGGAVPVISAADELVWALPVNEPPPIPPRTETLEVFSVGFGDLTIESLDITDSTGSRDHPSVDDFTIDLPQCTSLPCTLNELLPAQSGSFQIPIVYKNTDISTTDLISLHIYSTDPNTSDKIVLLKASDNPCLFPQPTITVETDRPCVGMAVRVNSDMSLPGGGLGTTIIAWEWHWLFAPPPEPELVPSGQSFTTFIPQRDGIYFLGLDVVNSCGARSQNPATEMINVSRTCN